MCLRVCVCACVFHCFIYHCSVADVAHGYVRGDLVQLCKEGSSDDLIIIIYVPLMLAQCVALSRALQHRQWEVWVMTVHSKNRSHTCVSVWTGVLVG